MEENIEVKDVQKTEYLDKTGLDMLWTKVKENTHNQVEVEYNRAKAKEDSLSQEIASVKPAEGKEFLQAEVREGGKILKDDILIFGEPNTEVFSCIGAQGIYIGNTASDIGHRDITIISTGIISDDDNRSGTSVWNTEGGITDLTSYALNSDVTEKIAAKADTTALTALEEKITANTTAIEGKQDAGNYIPFDETDKNFYKIRKPLKYKTSYNEFSLGDGYMLHAKDTQSDFGVMSGGITFTTGNKKLILDPLSISIHEREYCNFRVNKSEITLGDEQYSALNVKITSGGIKFRNRKNTEVPVADGSGFADLNDYVKKSEPQVATKEKLGVVKVGDGLNVTDGVISVDNSSVFIDMMSYGVEWDTTISDPACTRIGNPLLHKSLPIQSEYKGCLVKNGKVNYYLDPNDWSKKADGTPSVLDGTDGDVMVHIPKFYGKSGSKGTKRWVRISTTKIDPSWVEVPEMFVSAYKVTLHKDTDSNRAKVASVVNTTANYRGGSNRADYDKYLSTDKFRTDLGKPITNISRAQMRTNASNFGQELLCYEFYKWVFYWAYVIEYANFNSQKEFNSELTSDGYHQGGLGKGVTNINESHLNNYNEYNPLTPCGYTNEFGNFSGVKQMVIQAVLTDDDILVGSDTTTYANRWRGFENPFGDIFTSLDGIVFKKNSYVDETKVYTTTDSSKFGDDTSVMNVVETKMGGSGYVVEFDLGETGEIIPQSTGGSESTYKCDYHNAGTLSQRMLMVGGGPTIGGQSGLGYFSSYNSVDYTHSLVGFRSVIRA